MWGLPKTGSMSEAVPILIQLEEWFDNKWVGMEHFNDSDGSHAENQHVLNYFRWLNMFWILLNFFVVCKHDDDTSSTWNCHHPSHLCSESFWATTTAMDLLGLLTLPGYSRRRKRHEANKGWVYAIYFVFYYICLSEFFVEHRDHPPSESSSPYETEGCWGNSPAKKLSLLLQNAEEHDDKKLRLNLNLCFLNDRKALYALHMHLCIYSFLCVFVYMASY